MHLWEKINNKLFIEGGILLVNETYKNLLTYARYGLKRASNPLINPTKEAANPTIEADWISETNAFITLVASPLGKKMESLYNLHEGEWIYGEERLGQFKELNLTNTEHPVALLDMLDGSDLYKRQFSNWCIAVVFYIPKEAEIIASFVCDALGRIYYASCFEQGAYVVSTDSPKSRLKDIRKKITPDMNRRKEDLDLESSVLCFYGQKREDFKSIANQARLINSLNPDRGARIYNLGGNPMVARVADGSVDIVIQLGTGQKPHDAIPGLYIAHKAGAVIYSPEDADNELSFDSENIKKSLRRPNDDDLRIRYVVAATRKLAKQTIERLN